MTDPPVARLLNLIKNIPSDGVTPEWVERMARHLHWLRRRGLPGGDICERALYRAVLRGVDLHACEDASLCAFVALTMAPAVDRYVRRLDKPDDG